MAEIHVDDSTPVDELSNTQRAAINQERIIRNYEKKLRRDKRVETDPEVEADEPLLPMVDIPAADASPSRIAALFKAILPKRKAGDPASPEGPVAKKSRPEKPMVPNAPEELIYATCLTDTMKHETLYVPLHAFQPQALRHILYNQHTIATKAAPMPETKLSKRPLIIDWGDAALQRKIGNEMDMSRQEWQMAYTHYIEAIGKIWPPTVPGDDGHFRRDRWRSHFSLLDGYANDVPAKDFPAILKTDIEFRMRYAVDPFDFNLEGYHTKYQENLAAHRNDVMRADMLRMLAESSGRAPRPPSSSSTKPREPRCPRSRRSNSSSRAGRPEDAAVSSELGAGGPFAPGQARAQINAPHASNVGHEPGKQHLPAQRRRRATPRSVEDGTRQAPANTSTAPRAYTFALTAEQRPTTPSPGPAAPPQLNADDAHLFLDDLELHLLDPADVLNKIITPYDADAENFIRKHHLDQHAALPDLLRNGFPMGDFPELTESVEFKNHNSVEVYKDFVNESLDEEVVAGRMDGPYPTRRHVEHKLKSFVQVSPILVSVQTQAPGEKDKLRMCRHLSKGDEVHPSSNSYVDKKKFPTRSTTATKIGEYVSPISYSFRSRTRTRAHAYALRTQPTGLARTRFRIRTRVAFPLLFRTRRTALTHARSQIANAPPGTQAMSLDISKFHRTVPILPAHKKWFVVRGPRGYYIDHCAPFGGSGSSGNASKIATAIEDIWEAEIVDDPDHYEDDGIVPRTPLETLMEVDEPAETLTMEVDEPDEPTRTFHKPRIPVESVVVGTTTYHYAYSRKSALAAIEPLRVPWHPVKWTEFLFELVYIGFLWNLPEKRSSASFASAADARSTTSKKFHGSLCHICFVYPEGRSYLADITAFQNRFDPDKPLVTRYPPPSVYTALGWWEKELLKENIFRILVSRGEPRDLRIFVDASTSWGIGVQWDGMWAAWRGDEGWKSKTRHIGWHETIAVELVVRLLDAAGIHDAHILVHSDNQGVIGAFGKGRSRNHDINLALRRTFAILSARNIHLALTYVPTGDNPADKLSRGVPGPPSTSYLIRLNDARFNTNLAPRSEKFISAGVDLVSHRHVPRTDDRLVGTRYTDTHDLETGKLGATNMGAQTGAGEGRRGGATCLVAGTDPPSPLFTRETPPDSAHGPRPKPAPRPSSPEETQAPKTTKQPPRPRKPKAGNEIEHNEFRPAVLAKDRLRTVDKIVEALFSAFAPGTHDTYASGLLRYHQFCDRLKIDEGARVPASMELLTAFAAEHIGEVGGGTVKSWLSAVHAWHDVAGAPWHGETRLLELVRKSANKQGAKHSKPPRPPATIEHMLALTKSLARGNSEDRAVLACALTTFWGCRRLGETTIPKGDGFDPKFHVARSVYLARTNDGFSFHIPWTKSTGEKGGTVVLAERDDDLCPVKALERHLASTTVVPRGELPLFAFRDERDGQWRPLTKSYFLHRCNAVWKAAGLDNVAGHSFRIGGSSELLMAGVPPQIVAATGGWTSLAFLLYWRKLGNIIPKAIRSAYHKLSFEDLAKSFEQFRIQSGITTLQLNEYIIQNES
ncbi:hypothetical protein HMN09_00885500 [Mycena chlorophos]|uniref:DNA breaking-rejoining enzyme n=1 Tax=Mycena chlorophos TaxID=658473 RepID=A0A8H6SNA0_MYCCL|nr:hypothetical protein HMN09_00885500 [Mycena chlorophos]